jgi:hypothetical protein
MTKKTTTRLTLHRETVRELSDQGASLAVGGVLTLPLNVCVTDKFVSPSSCCPGAACGNSAASDCGGAGC